MVRTIRLANNWFRLLVVALCFLLDTNRAEADESDNFPFHLGFIHEGKIYAAADAPGKVPMNEFVVAPITEYDLFIWKAPCREADLRQLGVTKYRRWSVIARHTPLRWQLRNGAIWASNCLVASGHKDVDRIALEDLPILEAKNWPDSDTKYRNKLGKDPRWYLNPIEHLGMIPFSGWSFASDEVAYFDLLPTATDAGLLFLFQYQKLRVWDVQGAKSKKTFKEGNGCLWDLKFTERKDLGFATSLLEPFQAFGDADTWYFMTLSGKLYLCAKPPQGQKRKLELLYSDGDSPIKALITDSGTNRTFAFTAPDEPKSGKGKHVYFELAPKLDPKPYAVKPLTGIKIDYRVKSVWELSQVLIADSKVKLPPEK